MIPLIIDGVFRVGEPSERILALVSGYPENIRKAKSLVMVQVYADESIEHPVFVMAAFVSNAPRWAAFSDQWADILSLPLPRPIKYMKMREAMSLTGEFDGFDENDRNTRVKLFWEVINRNVDYGAVGFNHIPTYSDIIKGKISITFDSSYFILLWREN